MTSTDYAEAASMFALGFASNAGAWCAADSVAELRKCVTDDIDTWLTDTMPVPDWQIVWGPAVYVFAPGKNNVPTNVMFVAYNENIRSYFISVAGTNAASVFDELEDFLIHTLVPWPHGRSEDSVPRTSIGFRTGLEVLQRLRATGPDPRIRRAVTVDEYLRRVLPHGPDHIRIITGGHSQGGALSPLVALWLRDTKSSWDLIGKVSEDSFCCWRAAGLTPGDAAFAAYYDKQIPDTKSITNPLDVATLFFSEPGLASIEQIYTYDQYNIPPSEGIGKFVDNLTFLASGKAYTQIGVGKEVSFDRVMNTEILANEPPDCAFANQMGYQHVLAYFDLFRAAGYELFVNQETATEVEGRIGYKQFEKLC
jgi:Lipase (class 3)